MMSFGASPARPRDRAAAPMYPRLLGLGLLLVASACSGTAVDQGRPSDNGTGGSAGATEAGTAGAAGASETGGFGGDIGGAAPYPYDAGTEEASVVERDAADEPEGDPNLAGDVATPFDAGPEGDPAPVDAAPPPPPDPGTAGYAAEPYKGVGGSAGSGN